MSKIGIGLDPRAGAAQGLAAGAANTLARGWNVRDLIDLRVGTIPAAMASPPTITKGTSGAASTINGNSRLAAAIQPDSPKLTYAHGTMAARATSPTNFYEPNCIVFTDGSRRGNYISVRFMTDAPKFDFVIRNSLADYMVWVDGQPVSRDVGVPVISGGTETYHLVDFGADALTYQVEGGSITAGGSGHVAGDVITLTGGTATAQAKLLVATVSGGTVTQALVSLPGDYSAVPSSPVAQGSTTGAGTGFTFTPIWGQRHTTRKWRRIEIVMRNFPSFGGINVPSGCTVLPWPVSGERWVFVGDSITESTYTSTPAATWDEIAAQALGVWENSISYGVSGAGYTIATSPRPTWLQMLDGIIALQPTRIVVGFGVNDADVSSAAAIQAAAATGYATLAAALPGCCFFCLGPLVGKNGSLAGSTLTASNAIKAGFESVIPASRGVFCDTAIGDALLVPDTYAAPSAPSTGNTSQYTSSDGLHPSSSGHIYLGYGAANAIVRGAKRIVAAI